MKKLFFSLAVLFSVALVSCQKEDNISPIVADQPEVPSVDLGVDVVGTWTPTADTYFKILFYTVDGGELIDSVFTDLGETGFTFAANGTVDNPWEVPATYTIDSIGPHFNLMNLFTRDYEWKALAEKHMAFERTDTSAYTVQGDDGSTIAVNGVEIEHWDLVRQ